MSEEPKYIDGEKVLCYHGPLLYEAKCLKSQIKDTNIKYFIHYSGWNKKWDEWVPECRVLKFNEVNLAKQKELENIHIKKPKKSKSSKSTSKKVSEQEKEIITPVVEKTLMQPKIEKGLSIDPSAECSYKQPEPKRAKVPEPKRKVSEPKRSKVPKPKKAKLPEPKRANVPEPMIVNTENVNQRSEPSIVIPPPEQTLEVDPELHFQVKLNIPNHLKNWLIDDKDLICRKHKLVSLPSRITVDHIVAMYVREKVSDSGLSPSTEGSIIQEVNRVRDCFNVLLGKRLLYRFERPQYGEILAKYPGLKMSEVYGAVHMLRMFSILGKMLTPFAEKGINVELVVTYIDDFISYIGRNPTFSSLDDYVFVRPEYLRRAFM